MPHLDLGLCSTGAICRLPRTLRRAAFETISLYTGTRLAQWKWVLSVLLWEALETVMAVEAAVCRCLGQLAC